MTRYWNSFFNSYSELDTIEVHRTSFRWLNKTTYHVNYTIQSQLHSNEVSLEVLDGQITGILIK